MGDCLVTKLKATVDNPNLPIFNTLVINVNADTQSDDALRFSVSPVSGKSVEAVIKDPTAVFYHTDNTFTKVYGNHAIIVGNNCVTDDEKQIVDAGVGNYKILVAAVNDIAQLYLGSAMSVELSCLNKCTNLINMQARTGTMKCIGDIANVQNCVNATNFALGGSDCYGDITVLANFISLTNLDVRGSMIDSPNHTFSDLFNAMVQIGGRNSGTMRVYSNGKLGTEGVIMNIAFYPVSQEHPTGWEIQ